MAGRLFSAGSIALFLLAIVFAGLAVAAGVGLANSATSARAYRAAEQCPVGSAPAAHPPQWCTLTATVAMYYGNSSDGRFGVAGSPDPRFAPLSGVSPDVLSTTIAVDVEFYKNVPIITKLAPGDLFTATVNPEGEAASITYRGDTESTPASPLIDEASYTELIVAMALLAILMAGAGILVHTGRLSKPGRPNRVLRARLVTIGVIGVILYLTAIGQENTGSSASPMLAFERAAHLRAYIYLVAGLVIGGLDFLAARSRRRTHNVGK